MYESVFYRGAGKFISHGEWCHPNRTINSNEIIFVTEGTVYINEDGKEYPLKKNDLLLLEQNRNHFGYKSSTDTSFYWMHFVGGPEIDRSLKHQSISEPYNLSLLLKQLLHYRCANNPKESLDYLTRLILIECFSHSIPTESNRIVSEVSAWVLANRDSALKVEQIADHFGYNADYISRIFKAHYGKSLKEYIGEVRIDYIKQLLLSEDISLSDVAYQTGFGDYKYFLKFFKYHEGITPTQFLKIYPKTHINKK